jgi:flagellar basal-body rod modification protein FlgD
LTAITNTTTTAPTQTATAKSTADQSILGKDDFLKLLVTQLKNQDPMNPVEDKDFMAQMAQFSSVEQLANMSKSLERMSTAGQATQSVSLIGRTITWKKEDGSTGEGIAKAVSFGADGAITIAVGDGDDKVAPNEIESVK